MLGKVVRDKDVMGEFFRHAEESLAELRQKVLRDAGVIVFVDATREGDNHGRQVERIISGLKRTPILATMDGDGEIQDAIDRFVQGEGDYLIVKNSAGAGLDAARIKVVVDLSSVRQFASCEQRWNRAGTPTNGMHGSRITVATLITPDDVFSDEIFEDIYTKQGGECRETTDELLETVYKPKKPGPNPGDPLFVDVVDSHDIRDTSGLTAEAEEISDAKLFIEIAGKASGFNLGNITVPEGANVLRLFDQAKASKGDPEDDHLGGFEETTTKVGKARAFNQKAACELARIVYGEISESTMRLAWSSIYVEANRILSTRPGDKHYISSNVYRATTDMQVLDVVSIAIEHLAVRRTTQVVK